MGSDFGVCAAMSLDLYLIQTRRVPIYSANLTHNLNAMAEAAGIYKHLWRPDEIGITKASQLIDPLKAGLSLLLADPSRFKSMNPPNGWGTYDGLVAVVRQYIAACEEDPDSDVEVSR